MSCLTKKMLIIAAAVSAVSIGAFWALLFYRTEFVVSMPRGCNWLNLPGEMRFDDASNKDGNRVDPWVSEFDSLVFRQSPKWLDQYVFTALSTFGTKDGRTVYASPKYRFLIGARGLAEIASEREWTGALPVDTGRSFTELVESRSQLKSKHDALNLIRASVSGLSLYSSGDDLISPDFSYVAISSHTNWVNLKDLWGSVQYGMIYWDVFEFATQRKTLRVASLFFGMGQDYATGQAYLLPGGVLVIRPPLDPERLLVCKAQ